MEIIKLKFFAKQLSWIFLLLIGITVFSCNTSPKQNNNKKNLAKEVEDVKEELNKLMYTEKEELKNEVDSIVNDFNNQIYQLEEKIQKGTKKINAETVDLLEELKTKRDNLSVRINEIEKQTDKNWNEFRKELKHDTEQFAKSVKDFFEDNK